MPAPFFKIQNQNTALVLIVMMIGVFGYFHWQDGKRANGVRLDNDGVVLIFKNTPTKITYREIDKVHIACGHKRHAIDKYCGLAIYTKDGKTYTTIGFTDSDNAKKLRDSINAKTNQ